MSGRGIFRVALFALSFAAVSAYAFTVPQQAKTVNAKMATASQTTSGKIAAVAGDSFSLEVNKGANAETVQFQTDANTKIKGKLAVGAIASVEYRTDSDGHNIATTVVVESNG
jgi:Domain of unknown function (DUF5666)